MTHFSLVKKKDICPELYLIQTSPTYKFKNSEHCGETDILHLIHFTGIANKLRGDGAYDHFDYYTCLLEEINFCLAP